VTLSDNMTRSTWYQVPGRLPPTHGLAHTNSGAEQGSRAAENFKPLEENLKSALAPTHPNVKLTYYFVGGDREMVSELHFSSPSTTR
jgi:hypothetical protein